MISNYFWDFGDGAVSTETNPSHEYTTTGSYTVTLTVTGPGGSDDETKINYITVRVDTDGDGVDDSLDGCPIDPLKLVPGTCGCGIADTDSDNDGTPNCNDLCPSDPAKITAGTCGCGIADTDSDNDGTPDCHDPLSGGALLPTQTTIQMYASGQWPAMYPALTYTVKSSKINSISPGVIFYYNTIKAPSAAFPLTIAQTNTYGWKPMLVQMSGKNPQAYLYDSKFNIVSTAKSPSNTNPYTLVYDVKGATSGATYYIGIKYSSNNLNGITPTGGTSEYSFMTAIDNAPQVFSKDSILVRKK